MKVGSAMILIIAQCSTAFPISMDEKLGHFPS